MRFRHYVCQNFLGFDVHVGLFVTTSLATIVVDLNDTVYLPESYTLVEDFIVRGKIVGANMLTLAGGSTLSIHSTASWYPDNVSTEDFDVGAQSIHISSLHVTDASRILILDTAEVSQSTLPTLYVDSLIVDSVPKFRS